jgi:hypothetical protein
MEISLMIYLLFSLSIGSAIQKTWGKITSPWGAARDTLLISLFWPVALLLAAYDQIDAYRGEDWALN